MNAETTSDQPGGQTVAAMPVALFAAVMGISGLGLVWRKTADVFALSAVIGDALVMAGAAVFVVLALAYGRKALRFGAAVRTEFADLGGAGFFSAVPIGVLLIAAGWADRWPGLAGALFWVGILSMLGLAAVAAARLFRDAHVWEMANGSWLLAMVSPILAPLAGVPLGYTEMATLCLALGCAMWVLLFPVIMARFIFGAPVPPGMRPGWFILLVPPMIIFVGYLQTGTGELDFFARALFAMGVLLFVALLIAARDAASWPFTPAWWAFTFPLDGVAAAALTYYEAAPGGLSRGFAVATVAMATLVVALVAFRTLSALAGGRLLVKPAPPPPAPAD